MTPAGSEGLRTPSKSQTANEQRTNREEHRMKITITFFPDEEPAAKHAYRVLKELLGSCRVHHVKKEHIDIVYLTW